MIRPLLDALELDRELFAPWEQVFRDFSRIYDRYAGVDPSSPAVNVHATEDEAIVTIELPGATADSLDLSVKENVLTVSGERPALEADEDTVFVRQERQHGTFTRTLHLPFAVESDAVEATYRDGVLRIRLPRAEASKPRRITIKD